MAQQTAIDWLFRKIYFEGLDDEFVKEAKAIEKQQLKDAVIYGLDEDGHKGDWEIDVAESYYIKTFMGENNK